MPRIERALQWLIVLGTTAFVAFAGGDPGVPAGPHLLRRGVRSDLVGCYAVMTAPGHLLNPDDFFNSSPMVYLDSTPRPHVLADGRDLGTTRRMLIRLDSVGGPIHEDRPNGFLGPSWSADSLSDMAYMSFSEGFGGAELFLHAPPRSDTLRGLLIETSDVGPSTVAHGRGMAVRRPCQHK